MKKVIVWLIVLSVLFGSAFVFREPLTLEANKILYYSYCDKSISYRLGTIDPQFNISSGQLQSDILQAVNIWHQAAGKELFILDPEAELEVNMIFDQRQYLKSQIENLDDKTTKQKEKIVPNIDQFEKLASEFTKKITDLNSEIQYWNSQGGAPADIYDQLIEKQKQVREEADKLKQMAQILNRSTQTYNQEINKLNQTIRTFNQVLSERPEEGIYDPKEEKIDIYFNVNKDELIHTLAHEFGHALSLDHDSNPKSIMYPYTTQTIKASADDVEAVVDYCQQRNKLEYIYNKIKLRLSMLRYLL